MIDLRRGDALAVMRELPAESVQCCVTSPPYWGLRDYGVAGQLGLEGTPEEYVAALVAVFREVRRVLHDGGTLWLNLGDSYTSGGRGGGMDGDRGEKQRSNQGALLGPKRAPPGLKDKDLVGIPWRVAFALQADGWWLRSDIIWAKPNPMPESVTDRPTKAHEYLFLLSKSARYYYDADAIREPSLPVPVSAINRPDWTAREKDGIARESFRMDRREYHPLGRNSRSVWTIATSPYPEAHFATFPPELPRRCILAGSKEGDTVLDPFAGAGTTGLVANRLGRAFIGIELNPKYVELARARLEADAPLFNREHP